MQEQVFQAFLSINFLAIHKSQILVIKNSKVCNKERDFDYEFSKENHIGVTQINLCFIGTIFGCVLMLDHTFLWNTK